MLLSDRRCLRTYVSDGESVSETCQDMEQNCLVLRVQQKAIAEEENKKFDRHKLVKDERKLDLSQIGDDDNVNDDDDDDDDEDDVDH